MKTTSANKWAVVWDYIEGKRQVGRGLVKVRKRRTFPTQALAKRHADRLKERASDANARRVLNRYVNIHIVKDE